MKLRRTAALIVLVLWILAGPGAAVFGSCAAMCVMCDGPCGVGPCAIVLLLTITAVLFVLGITASAAWSVPAFVVRLVDPPPRLVLSV